MGKIKKLFIRISSQNLNSNTKKELTKDYFYFSNDSKSNSNSADSGEVIFQEVDPDFLLKEVINNQSLIDFMQKANENIEPLITKNFYHSYLYMFPEKIIDYGHLPLSSSDFDEIVGLIKNPKDLFSVHNLKENNLAKINFRFWSALKLNQIKISAYNFFNLKFSSFPEQEFDLMFEVFDKKIENSNLNNVISEFNLLLEYKRMNKIVFIFEHYQFEKVILEKFKNDKIFKKLSKDKKINRFFVKGNNNEK
jgi:hypothetical protein